ncbi:hypothetical protein [Actinomadura kijaniata]|uniref:hypothetical protein n=1 Tax=Actinomadura kijaniata TaxID=46161 RepID=UPI000A008D8C|nr:hypothetical protein [Actinomadura kijaniata]
MDRPPSACARTLRRLRTSRGWSWSDLVGHLQTAARALRITRIAAAQPGSIRRTVARWESGKSTPDEQYQLLLAYTYARTPTGAVALGPSSDLAELLDGLAAAGVEPTRLDELTTTVAASITSHGMSLLAFLGGALQNDLTEALADPTRVDLPVLEGLAHANNAVNAQIGSVPFVRLHLAQAAIVDSCRHLLQGTQPDIVRTRLRDVASRSYALAARIAFETRDDAAALRLHSDAVATADPAAPSQRALIRTSQTMVVYYSTGDITRARRIADAAAQDARRGPSALMRARAHALQAEMAARAARQRHAQAALHLAWHDLEGDIGGDPMPGAFSAGRLRGFEGVCGIFLGAAEAAEQQLTQAAGTLTRTRESVQRSIVLADRALARLHTQGAGAAETSAEQLHECVDLVAATRARVPAQRLRQARLELRPWRSEGFVGDLDDHIHTALIGL